MTKTKSKFEQRVKDIKDICEREILNSQIAIPFYKTELEKCDNVNEKTKLEMKVKQIQDALAFNERYLEYLNTL
jgi:hypothetical protein